MRRDLVDRCAPTPTQEAENLDHQEFEAGVQDGYFVLLADEITAGGRVQKGATLKAGEILIFKWHDPKNDGNWHHCGGFILPRGSLDLLTSHMTRRGFRSVSE